MTETGLIKRITVPRLIYWWVMRIIMFSILLFPYHSTHENMLLQLIVNFVLLFIWEIFQLFPKNSSVRNIPPYMQDLLIPLIFLTTYLGAYFDFYYTVWWWDSLIHIIGGLISVILGYEIVHTLEKRDGSKAPVAIAVLCAFSMSFVVGGIWEIFEFSFDQLTGSDSQHWCFANNNGMYQLFNPSPERFPLMDTMTDILCNTLGGIIALIILKINPYYHKTKDSDTKAGQNILPEADDKEAEEQKETASEEAAVTKEEAPEKETVNK